MSNLDSEFVSDILSPTPFISFSFQFKKVGFVYSVVRFPETRQLLPAAFHFFMLCFSSSFSINLLCKLTLIFNVGINLSIATEILNLKNGKLCSLISVHFVIDGISQFTPSTLVVAKSWIRT